MNLKSLILNYRLEHEGKLDGIEQEIMKEIERLLPEKEKEPHYPPCSCRHCYYVAIKNQTISACLSAIRTGMEGKV